MCHLAGRARLCLNADTVSNTSATRQKHFALTLITGHLPSGRKPVVMTPAHEHAPQALEQAALLMAHAADDPALQKLESLMQAGAAFMQAMQGPNLAGRLQALTHRLDNGLSTPSDRALLTSLPACHLEPDELVRLFSRADHFMLHAEQLSRCDNPARLTDTPPPH